VTDRSQLRLVVLGVLVVSLVFTLIGRLWYLQVLNGKQYSQSVIRTYTRDIVTQPARGIVYDDTGQPLIDNKTALVVSVNRTTLNQQADGGKAVLGRLATLLHKPYALLQHETQECGRASNGKTITAPCWTGSPYQPIPVSEVKPDTTHAKRALQIEDLQDEFPGVSVQLAAVRNYPRPDGANASTILGYINGISEAQLAKLSATQQVVQRGSQVGQIGVEAGYENYLHGTPGLKVVNVDNQGVVTGTKSNTAAVPGDDLVTNLDAKAQATLESELKNAIAAARAANDVGQYAAGVVLNVKTGGVVAMASDPTYAVTKPPPTLTEAQYKKESHEGDNVFYDKAYQGQAAPGSTFKLISASGLLNDGAVTQSTQTDCKQDFDGKKNFEGESFGAETLHTAIVKSCDTVFYQLANTDYFNDADRIKAHQKPLEGVQSMARAYGIASPVKLDIPGATEGTIGDRANSKALWDDKKFREQYCIGAKNPTFSVTHRADDAAYCKQGYIFAAGDQMNEDIGQGTVTVSPLQLAVAYSALANGGTVYEPRIVKAIMSPAGKLIKRIKPTVRDHLPISASNLDYIRNAMYGVTHESGGTAQSLFANFPMGKVDVGGKTGTAELTGTQEDGSWFASFAGPAGGAPQYVTVIEVNKAQEGADGAGPFVKSMWDHIYGLQGQTAIFPNGVPPTKLPNITPKALRTKALRQAKAKAHPSTTPSGSTTPGATTSTSPGTTTTSNPASPPPSSPATGAAGLPPGLPVSYRREVLE
jgi:penicillin-binding protein 2